MSRSRLTEKSIEKKNIYVFHIFYIIFFHNFKKIKPILRKKKGLIFLQLWKKYNIKNIFYIGHVFMRFVTRVCVSVFIRTYEMDVVWRESHQTSWT